MKKLFTVTAIALAATLSAAPAMADTIDPNNPNVVNPRIDEDGQRDIQSRWADCKTLQNSLAKGEGNATTQQMDSFNTQCNEFIDTRTGELGVDPSVTNELLGVESNTAN